jgi:uroporphyrinogen decarboxylase
LSKLVWSDPEQAAVTPRERVLTAIRHEQPDRVPWHFTFTQPARQALQSYYGTTGLDDLLGNHFAAYRPQLPGTWLESRPGRWRDEFGVVWNRTLDKDIGVVEERRLGTRSLEPLRLPDPRDPARWQGLPAFSAANAHRFRYVSVPYSLFERAWSLRGMTELMIDMLEAPEFVDDLLDAIAAFQCGIVEEALRYDIDAVKFGDDWGQQTGLLFGERLWRRFLRPRLATLFGMVKRAGKAVVIHSCGRVQGLFPELIELGLDVFNPFQPEVMDPFEMKRQFGRHLTFFGGVSVQALLPFGTPRQVRDQTRRLMDTVGRGGGFIIAPSHDVPAGVPVENMAALVEAVHNGDP